MHMPSGLDTAPKKYQRYFTTEYEAFGLCMTLADWAVHPLCKVSKTMLYDRVNRGWLFEDALSIPAMGHSRYNDLFQKHGDIVIMTVAELWKISQYQAKNPYLGYGYITFHDSNVPPEDDYDNFKCETCRIVCDDTEGDDPYLVAPTRKMIRGALRYAKRYTDIVCACTAGISRSSAMAILVSYQKTQNAYAAIGVIDRTLHWPNKRIIQIGDELMKAKGTLISCVSEMVYNYRGLR